MGRVFLAIDEALNREVAIKTLLPSSHVEWFVNEAKIMARLQHPCIPPLYTLGTLPNGTPWLAMKLIRGQTLAELLASRRNEPPNCHDLSRFLLIFEQVAQAVGFAHSRGIIHRDLKPVNIFVGEFGEVQVMDWGLAEDLANHPSHEREAVSHQHELTGNSEPDDSRRQLEDANVRPATGMVMGTPGYMAPEQARGEPVDARADVFSLGAILAAILTGQPAFVGTTVQETIDKATRADLTDVNDRLAHCGADAELVQMARHCLAAKPEDRFADGRDVAAAIASYRATVEARLRQAETAAAQALVREVELRKRRRLALAAATSISGVLLVGMIVSQWQMRRAVFAESLTKIREEEAIALAEKERMAKLEAEEQRRKAERNLSFAKKGNEILGAIFAGLDPKNIAESGRPLQDLLRDHLAKAVKELEGSAIGEPLEVAAMQNTLGLSLLGLGEAKLAVEVFEKALQTWQNELGTDHPDTLQCMSNLARSYRVAGKIDKALNLYEETYRLQKTRLGADHPQTLNSLNNLATTYRAAGHIGKSVSLLEDVLRLRQSKLGADHPDTLQTMNNLGVAYRSAGQIGKALSLWEETFKLRKARLGVDHPETLSSMNNLALAYRDLGKLDQALPLWEQTLKLRREKLGADHPSTLLTMNNLAVGYRDARQIDKALPLWEQALNIQQARLGRDHPETLTTMNNLAAGYRIAGKIEKALALFEESLQLTLEKFGPDHPNTLVNRSNLAMAYLAARQIDKALPLLEQTLERQIAKLGKNHHETLIMMHNLAMALREAGQLDKALQLWEETLKLKEATLGKDHPETHLTRNSLAETYHSAGRLDQALPLFEQIWNLRKTKLGPDHEDTLVALGNLARAYCDAKQRDKAVPFMRDFIAHYRNRLPKEDRTFAVVVAQVGHALLQCGEFPLAEEMLRECLAIRKKKEPDAWTTFNTLSLLGQALLGQKKYREAEPLLLKGYEGLKARRDSIPPQVRAERLSQAVDALIELYTAMNQSEHITKWQAERSKVLADNKR
jgi:serine/threonine protein kinase